MSWIKLCKFDDIPRLGARTACLPTGRVAVFRTGDDRVFALADICPHKQGPLSQGIIHGTRVTCPLHDWVVELETGSAVAPDEGLVTRYDVRVVDGEVEILAEKANAA